MKPFDLGRKEGPTESACEMLCRSSLVKKESAKKIIRKHKKPEKCKKRSVQAGISEKLWALKVNGMLFIWMDHITGRNDPLTLWSGAYESFPLLWLSIQGSTLFTFLVSSVDRFSELPNNSRCAYESGVSSCISINSAWGGSCSISPCAFMICGSGLATSAFLWDRLSWVNSWYFLSKHIQFSVQFPRRWSIKTNLNDNSAMAMSKLMIYSTLSFCVRDVGMCSVVSSSLRPHEL